MLLLLPQGLQLLVFAVALLIVKTLATAKITDNSFFIFLSLVDK
ncbi:hypothetical protein MNB_SUP05-12-1027 [hydrothermal vent metagenome]|uniref:Uncharacterized protein n=1 Tax=hydrothermal vent metagenome TaxID=652676 RepID=A0A1W1DGB5_9ZZZZ